MSLGTLDLDGDRRDDVAVTRGFPKARVRNFCFGDERATIVLIQHRGTIARVANDNCARPASRKREVTVAHLRRGIMNLSARKKTTERLRFRRSVY